ncbi:substrate-binding domain-containing protein [Ulvibacterium marinum]|uniref:LacI family transcriptional regulator n=1 Tax=Ulvibacterium marinum TaxID=2419782 RepID=A0A3B0C4F3_9FLAO|nr:LacI family DNA-binding transcriptional regulator [Ulvibacterium marinum]RKN79411.1 LacI family transcriptional regulator [Ulvibacterium marinum]
MNKKSTIKEIAKLANVSIATVDRVLHNRGGVAKKTARLVKKIIADTNYVPNTFARNLVLKKSFKIAVLLPEHGQYDYWSGSCKAAKMANKDFKFLSAVTVYHYNQKEKTSLYKAGIQILKDKNDAVLLTQVILDEANAFLEDCKKRKIPFILMGCSRLDLGAISYFKPNLGQGGRLAAELLSMGQKEASKFLVLNIETAQERYNIVKERITGFESYFKRNKGRNFEIEVFSISWKEKNIAQKIRDKLNSDNKILGVFVPNSKSFVLAKIVYSFNHIRIVGYDISYKNQALLKTGEIDFLINQRPYEQTYLGIEYLYKYLEMGQNPPKVVSLPLDIVTREKLIYN